ncbi:MAG: hypothetical protein SOH58_02755 [Olsenella sp.]|jgi:hypothetical protein
MLPSGASPAWSGNARPSRRAEILLEVVEPDHVADHRGVEPHADTDVTALSPAGSQLLEALLGFSATADAGGVTPDEAEWLYRSLAAVESGDDERANAQLAATPRR